LPLPLCIAKLFVAAEWLIYYLLIRDEKYIVRLISIISNNSSNSQLSVPEWSWHCFGHNSTHFVCPFAPSEGPPSPHSPVLQQIVAFLDVFEMESGAVRRGQQMWVKLGRSKRGMKTIYKCGE
jgi:hypothetical protein